MPNLIERRITFGGEVVPAFICSAPKIIRATRKMNVVQVPGSSREIVDMEDAWECYDQPYSLFVGDGSQDSIQGELDEVARVLFKKDWQILLDDYEPDVYRLAYYQGGFEAENRKTFLGKFEVSFRCRPERFLRFYDHAISVQNNGTLYNPTEFNAKPLIHVTGTGTGTLTIAGQTITLKNMVDYLNIDCDKQDVYRLSSENRNNCMEGEFPVLFPKTNTVGFTGGIESVSITPKFWII